MLELKKEGGYNMKQKYQMFDLVNNYRLLLLDGSAIRALRVRNNIPYPNTNMAFINLKKQIEEDKKYIDLIMDWIDYGFPIYVTSGILSEIAAPPRFSDTKRIKSLNKFSEK